MEMGWESCEEVGNASPDGNERQAGFSWQHVLTSYVLQIDYKGKNTGIMAGEKKFLKWCT
jgi:hypothetical protein